MRAKYGATFESSKIVEFCEKKIYGDWWEKNLVQNCSNSIGNTLELLQSCAKPQK